MADEPENPGQDAHFNPARPAPEMEAEARILIDAILEGHITPGQHQRLEKLVVENPSVAQLYLEVVHIWYSIPLHVAGASVDLVAANSDIPVVSDHPMDESMVLPAIREAVLDDEDQAIDLPSITPTANAPEKANARKLWWGSSAAALVIAAGIFWMLHSGKNAGQIAIAPVGPGTDSKRVAVVTPVMITATAGARAKDPAQSAVLSPGTPLADGQLLQFTDGAVELTFPSGAVVVVQGPVRLHIIDRNAVALEAGAITAHVPPPARGFRITSPGLTVVDQGTNFGVRSLADGSDSEAIVFEGKVDVTGTDSTGRSISPVIQAIAGQALRHDASAAVAPALIPFEPAGFIRDIAATRLPVPMHGTGDGAAPGSPDANWQIVSVPNNANWAARPAMVMGGLNISYTKDVPNGKWIGVNGVLDDQPVGTFVFRTTVDLTEFDPATATITASIAADDYVSDILINGVSTKLSTSPDNPDFCFKRTEVKLPASMWRQGVNQVDILVVNNPNTNNPNGMLLHLDWKATAAAAVHR